MVQLAAAVYRRQLLLAGRWLLFGWQRRPAVVLQLGAACHADKATSAEVASAALLSSRHQGHLLGGRQRLQISALRQMARHAGRLLWLQMLIGLNTALGKSQVSLLLRGAGGMAMASGCSECAAIVAD